MKSKEYATLPPSRKTTLNKKPINRDGSFVTVFVFCKRCHCMSCDDILIEIVDGDTRTVIE